MAALPEPWKSLRAELEKLREQIRALYNRSPFFGTGMHANGVGGIDSDNFVAGTSGYSFKSDGNAEFNDLTLRGGIIGNDALTDPVIPGSVWAPTAGFSVGLAWGTVASQSVTVPAGCTRLEADCRARITAFYNNVGTGIDYLYAHLTVGGQSSGYYPLAVTDNGGSGTNHVFRNVLLTGLTPGSTVTFALQASTGYNNWAGPTTNNEAQIGASLRWLR